MPWSNEELFEVIDENGKVIGQKPRGEVHSKGLRHKAIYLMIRNSGGLVFIQQRAKDKDLMPLKWDFSCAEHSQPGESWGGAASRGAREELGIKVRNMKFAGEMDWKCEYENGLKDDELNQFFVADFEGELEFKDGEVKQGKWVKLGDLLREMQEKPEKFTPWFLNCKKQLEKLT